MPSSPSLRTPLAERLFSALDQLAEGNPQFKMVSKAIGKQHDKNPISDSDIMDGLTYGRNLIDSVLYPERFVGVEDAPDATLPVAPTFEGVTSVEILFEAQGLFLSELSDLDTEEC